MILSTRSRYGVRILFELAYNYGRGPVLLKDIAARQEISEKYLSKIIILLRSAGLVVSYRGSKGGYTLSRQPGEIKMREAVEALEGNLTLIDCIKDPENCGRVERCATRDFWYKMAGVMNDFLESETLETLVENFKRKTGESGDVYYI